MLHGTTYGASVDARYETDAMTCPTCATRGDGVLFEASIAAVDQLTQGWTAAKKSASAKQEGLPYGHLEMGATPTVWNKMSTHLGSLD